jgi:hypothetical protein
LVEGWVVVVRVAEEREGWGEEEWAEVGLEVVVMAGVGWAEGEEKEVEGLAAVGQGVEGLEVAGQVEAGWGVEVKAEVAKVGVEKAVVVRAVEGRVEVVMEEGEGLVAAAQHQPMLQVGQHEPSHCDQCRRWMLWQTTICC